MKWLEALAALASIATALVAVYAYGRYRLTLHRRVSALEELLAKKNQPRDDSLTLRQLAIALTLTENQVIEAASLSKKIESSAGQSGKDYRFKLIRN